MSRRTPPSRLVAALLTTLALIVLSACSGTAPSSGPGPSPSPVTRTSPAAAGGLAYVALGDSYTAAPYVPLTDLALGCLRSDHDYPQLLAKRLGTRVRDVSCSGAKVADLTGRQPTFRGQSVPAQLAAVRRTTGLVTVGIGGNDDGLFATLVAGCPVTFPGIARMIPAGSRCGAVDVPAALRAISDIGGRLRSVLAVVHRRAPHAQVVLVGYPRIVSTTRTCPPRVPIALADAAVVDRMTRLLARTMRDAARATRTSYVDLYRASAGHDVCSSDPWVNGVHTDTARAAALHPYAAEQAAVARLVARVVRR